MGWEVAPERLASLTTEVRRLLSPQRDQRNGRYLSEYLEVGGGYSGGYFERLGKGIHGPNEIGCHDLLSLNLLTDQASGILIRDLLAGRPIRRRVERLLEKIPDVDLWRAPDEALDTADELWEVLRNHPAPAGHEMRNARLSKLLARKRPKLIPISDSIVRSALPLPRGVGDRWTAYRSMFSHHPELVARLQTLKGRRPISLLRTFDIIAWMHHVGLRAR